ncbi:MAG: hypothetical protein EAY81_04370 [Bacteroidetes bacterium]|nr:MAG: hypothetical protein EAY81_04370 [Bacteroidota bacterium]
MSFVAQDSRQNFTLITGLRLNVKCMETDNLGNLYVVTKTNQLYKYGRNGKLLSTLNFNYIGNITQLDASNPMEIYLFYKELNKVVFLDNNLAFRGEINLNKANIIQASAIARSYDNNIWVFDLGDLQLKKVNKTNEVEQESGNIRQYISGNAAVNYMFDNNDRVFVVDSLNGILLFDIFASYIKTIPVKGVSDIKVLDKYLFYFDNQQLSRYNWQTPKKQSFELPDTLNLRKLSIEKERLYLQKADSIYIYSY